MGRLPSLLSRTRETSANPIALRDCVPSNTTSSILEPRSSFELISPRTQRMASVILLFPLPFGPTMAVIPSLKWIVVLSGNDLKPWISNDFRCMNSFTPFLYSRRARLCRLLLRAHGYFNILPN